MSIVTRCREPGCRTLTIGEYCVDHDLAVERVFERGRAFRPPTSTGTSPSTDATRGLHGDAGPATEAAPSATLERRVAAGR